MRFLRDILALDLLRREYAAWRGDADPFRRCIVAIASAPSATFDAVDTLFALERAHGRSACTASLLLYYDQTTPLRAGRANQLAAARYLSLHPVDDVRTMLRAAETLQGAGEADEALRITREAAAGAPNATSRAVSYVWLARRLEASGRASEATSLHRALSAALARDGRPGPLMASLAEAYPPSSDRQGLVRDLDATVELSSASPLAGMENAMRAGLGYADHLGELSRAAEVFRSAAATADRLGFAHAVVAFRVKLGRTRARMGHTAEGEAELHRALSLAREIGDAALAGEAWHDLAHVYESQSRWAEAVPAVDSFIEVMRPMPHSSRHLISFYDAGIIRWKAGLHEGSRRAFREMVRVVEAQERHYYWAGEHSEREGDLAAALRYYRLALTDGGTENGLAYAGLARLFERLGLPDSARAAAAAHDEVSPDRDAGFVPLLPALLAREGRLEEGLRLARLRLAAYRRAENREAVVVSELQLARLLLDGGSPEEAAAEAEAAARSADALQLTDQRTAALRLAGRARSALGQHAAAIDLLERAARLAEEHPTEEALLSTRSAVAEALLAAGELEPALDWFDRAARVVESTAGLLPLDGDRGRFRASNRAPFDGALRALLDSPSSPATLDRLLRWSQRRAGAPLGGGRSGAEPLDLEALRARLGPAEALLVYLALDARVWGIVVGPGASALRLLPIGPDSMAALVRRVRGPMDDVYGGRLDLARATFDRRAAAALHRAVLEPLLPLLHGVERLWVVPDGALHLLPMDVLVTASGELLVERMETVLLPSARALPLPGRAPGRIGRLLAVGFDAPGDSAELERVRSAAGADEVQVLAGPAATEAAVARAARGADALHFAAHARADPVDPLASHLRLAAGEGADGFLHASEIAASGWGARLVVLSGCETLRGPLYEGEGLMGLARAFQAAGAEWVIATSWPIGASSAELMTVFYRRLSAGDEPGRALRAAKLDLLRRADRAHPFHWAGFVIIAAG